MDGFRVDYQFPDEGELATEQGAIVGRLFQNATGSPLYSVRRIEGGTPGTTHYGLFVGGTFRHGYGVQVGTPWEHVLDWAHTEIFRDGRVAAGGERFVPIIKP